MSTTALRRAFVAGCAVFVGAAPLRAQDWPQWRGPDRSARATGFNAPSSWPQTLTQKWKVTVGDGVATPALVGDRIYVFSRQGDSEITRCLNASDGKEIWQDSYPSQPATGAAASFPGPRSSPVVAEGKIVTLGVRGMLSCLDAATGKKIWRKDDFHGAWPRFFTASSPIVLDGLCIAQLGGPGNGGIAAYELASGTEKWKWTGDGPSYASPMLLTVGDLKLIVAVTDKNVVAVSAADGKLVWETPFVPAQRNYNAATPIVDGSTVIYAGGGRGLRAVRFEKMGVGSSVTEVWNNAKESVQFNTPVLKDGLLYGLSQNNEFFCVNARDGKTMWTASSGGQRGDTRQSSGGRGRGGRGGGYGAIVDAGSVLLALTPTSELTVIQPSGNKYTEMARIKVADGPTYAYPIASGDHLFVKDRDTLTLWAIR
jgi:outer membrane protein assembly factor BamB